MKARDSLRSLLFVPGDSETKLGKISKLDADAVIIDWEDAVSQARKEMARKLTREFLTSCNPCRAMIAVRVNATGTEEFGSDCEALRDTVPDAVMMPKCNTAEQAGRLAAFLDEVDSEGECGILPLVESPLAVLNAYSIARSSNRVIGLAFGAEDFSAEAHIERGEDEVETLYARSAVVVAARAAGREPIDSPWLEYADLKKVRESAWRARRMGFSGKLAIHPAQIAILHEVFSPSDAEVAEARALLEKFDARGRGVVGIEGKMIDEAVLRSAREMVKRWRRDQ